jgi:hypothetical protein
VKQFCRLTWYEVDEANKVIRTDATDGQIEDLLPTIHTLNAVNIRWRLTSMVEDES